MKEEEHAMLARIDERTLNMAATLSAINIRLNAHADKISGLEKWRNLTVGGLTALASIFGLRG